MHIRAWTPVESIDDDILSLESAAVLSLLAKYKMPRLTAAVKKWQQVQSSFDGSAQERARVERAITVLRNLLKSTGLVLPSLLENNRLSSLEGVTNEMSSIVRGPLGIENSPQAAVALLNLACEDSLKQDGIAANLLDNQLIDRAWEHIVGFVTGLRHNSGQGPAPTLKEPLGNDWMAHEQDLLGDYTPWSLGIGPMFHTLAGWDSTWLMHKGMIQDELWRSISYWTPLPHLALGPLGWSDPALGVARWILMGMPNETPELSLVSRVWGTDALMYFAHPQMDWLPQPHASLGFELQTSGRQVSQIYEKLGNAKAFSECGSLHMHVHLQWQLGIGIDGPPPGESRVYSSMEGHQPKFVLELERMAGWRSQLYAAGDDLPLASPGCEVEVMVVAAPVGPLGSFRRSRVTGLWYSGSHEAHLLGHSDLDVPLRRLPSTEELRVRTPALVGSPPIRHTKALAFWLASELARRHPHYVLHSEGLDRLTLVSPAGPTVAISRTASVSVGGRELVSPSELLAADDPRALIRELEEKIGLPIRRHAAPTTERTLIYRAMAHIAALVVSDKATWDFVATDLETPAGSWNLIRNGRCVALLMPDGNVRISDQPVNLLERYHAHSHRMTAMIGEVFGPVLP